MTAQITPNLAAKAPRKPNGAVALVLASLGGSLLLWIVLWLWLVIF